MTLALWMRRYSIRTRMMVGIGMARGLVLLVGAADLIGLWQQRVLAQQPRTISPFPHAQGIPMNKTLLPLAALCAALFTLTAGAKEGGATKEEATALVKKGVALIKSGGKDKAYGEFSNKAGSFVDRDLYLVVYGLDGTVRAHGANEKMIGKNLIEMKDIDGKPYVKERVELAQAKGTFWQDYKFTNPVSRKIEPKRMYCERLEDSVVCGGIYK